MNDSDLKTILNRLKTPSPSEVSREQALRAAQEALNQPTLSRSSFQAAPEPVIPFLSRRMVALGGALAACVALVASLILLNPKPEAPLSAGIAPALDADRYSSERRIFEEIEQLFPGQVAFILMENGESRIEIDDNAGTARGKPLVLRLRSAHEGLVLTSFSGQRVEIDFAGRHYTVELLLSGKDEVILVADEFVWNPSEPFPLDGVQAFAGIL